jgi:hypothetical protein
MKCTFRAAALAVLSLACTAVHAETRTFVFKGKVLQSQPMAAEGQVVRGRFTYDLSTPASTTGGDPAGPGFGHSSYHVQGPMRAKVNGHTITCTNSYVDVFNNTGGSVEDHIVVYCGPITLDGTYLAGGSLDINLMTGPGRSRAVRSTELPRNINFKRFGYSEGTVRVDDSSNGVVVWFQVTSVKQLNADDEEDD